MEEIKKILLDYKECTINIINLLEGDNFDSLQGQIEKRECSLNKLISFTQQKEEAKGIYQELQIEKFQRKAEEIIKVKSSEIKEKLNDISKNKKASNAYGLLGSNFSKIFSKKI